MDLSIITVNYNSLDYLRVCIKSICRYTTGCTFEIIVVDNASPKPGIDELKKEFPEVKIIKSDRNLGFSGANNLGFRNSSGEFLLFLNPDTELRSPAIETMLGHARTLNPAGIMGCRLLNGDLSVQTSSILKFPSIFNNLLEFEYFRLRWPKLFGIGPLFSSNTDPVAVDALSGACMLVRRDVFERVGTFSEDYFMYSEDLDLCYQTLKAGYSNYYLGDASIVHFGGKSSPGEWQISMKLKSELTFCAKHYGETYRKIFCYSLILNACARLFLVSVVSLFMPGSTSLKAKSEKWKLTLRTLLQSSSLTRDQLQSRSTVTDRSVSKA
jgi:GT2 family glycosyltransferase